MVAKEQEKYGWEFLFLGANIDAAKEAGRLGIAPERAARFHNDRKGTALNYDVLGDVVCSLRMGVEVEDNWAAPIRADYEDRKNNH